MKTLYRVYVQVERFEMEENGVEIESRAEWVREAWGLPFGTESAAVEAAESLLPKHHATYRRKEAGE